MRIKKSWIPERLDRDVEMALYYARADQVSKDYRIREISLEHTVREAVKRQKQLLISNGMSVDIDCGDATAFCDEKWIEFILGQMFANAVKYKKGACGHIHVSARKKQEAVLLIVEDDGRRMSTPPGSDCIFPGNSAISLELP